MKGLAQSAAAGDSCYLCFLTLCALPARCCTCKIHTSRLYSLISSEAARRVYKDYRSLFLSPQDFGSEIPSARKCRIMWERAQSLLHSAEGPNVSCKYPTRVYSMPVIFRASHLMPILCCRLSAPAFGAICPLRAIPILRRFTPLASPTDYIAFNQPVMYSN